MSKIDTVVLDIDGELSEYLIMDKETARDLLGALDDIRVLKDAKNGHAESIDALENAVSAINKEDEKTASTLRDHEDRIFAVKEQADNNDTKYLALSKTVESEQGKLADEIQRAKDVEGALDQLKTPTKDSLVSAINHALSRADKADENTGQIKSLKTEEKDSVVGAVNEVYGYFGGIRFSKTLEGYLHIEDANA